MDSLLIGGALALLMHGPLRERVLQSAKSLFFAVIAVLVAINLLRPVIARTAESIFVFDTCYLSLRYTLMALGSAALIAWCLQPTSIPRRVFENRVLRFFGKYSYGLYVLHFVALPFLLKVFRGWIRLVTLNKGIQVAGAGVLSFLVAIAAAYLSYNLYEKRFLRLKRFFDYERPVHTDGVETAVQMETVSGA
jgi:peptidoglycan/LPS O-acetylase OafA/YrhL